MHGRQNRQVERQDKREEEERAERKGREDKTRHELPFQSAISSPLDPIQLCGDLPRPVIQLLPVALLYYTMQCYAIAPAAVDFSICTSVNI